MKRSIRRPLMGVTACLVILVLFSPAAQEKTVPVPSVTGSVAITVRVFDGDRFVSGLSLGDFEIEEAGMAVSPRALFELRKGTIERQEGRTGAPPDVSRRIVLLFQMTEYHSKIPEALDFLFRTELLPADILEIETPIRSYGLSREALAAKPRAALARELGEIVRKDIVQGGMAYNSAIRDLKRMVRQIGGVRTGLGDTEGEVDDGTSLEQQLMQYGEHLERMETLRAVDESRLIAFARRMRSLKGQKLVFIVYQREFRPEISSQTLDTLVMDNQERPDILAALQTLFSMYQRPVNVNPEPVVQAFADSGMDFHFLFMNRQPERVSGITMREQSEDVYKMLSSAAEATGGGTDTSQNPAASLAAALRATEQSYLLLYAPSTAAPPGTFIDLKVRVKGKDYRVTSRSGYLSRSARRP